jgi:glycosyltransferase involved in cell wall biosynthesis
MQWFVAGALCQLGTCQTSPPIERLESSILNNGCPKEELMTGVAECPTGIVAMTIAVPAYNRCSSVQILLKSICEQARTEDEVIVSDDGSTDGTSEQSSTLPSVRVIRHEKNQGMVANWNSCLTAATRDWICIVHDDDRLASGALEALRCACALTKGPALIVHEYAGNKFKDVFRCHYSEPNSWTVLNCPTIPSGAIVHRAIIDRLGMFDTRFKYSSDLEYFARIAARFPVIVVESPRIVEYQLHGANYQFETWRHNDFYDQFEELQRSIISHAGIHDEQLRSELLKGRMVSNLLYMLNLADRLGDRRLVRQIAKHCQRFRARFTVLQKITTYIAAMTGRCPRLHQAKPLGPRTALVE